MPRAQLEEYIARGEVLIAERAYEPRPSGSGAGDDVPKRGEVRAHNPLPHGRGSSVPGRGSSVPGRGSSVPVGYIIGRDRYFKREDVGIIYQLVVAPGSHRALVGAALVKAVFERAAYGCKLFCCWCAQDIEANKFWEALGFVPLAFRAGSKSRSRVHIFWQRRVREGDTDTPWWFPSQTGGGAIREDRLVLPIPPGTHWSEAKPLVLPGVPGVPGVDSQASAKALPGKVVEEKEPSKRERPVRTNAISAGGLRFVPSPPPPEGAEPPEADERAAGEPAKKKAVKKAPRNPRRKNDPRHVAAARELRDRYLEEVARRPGVLAASSPAAKYDVGRALGEGAAQARMTLLSEPRLLDAA